MSHNVARRLCRFCAHTHKTPFDLQRNYSYNSLMREWNLAPGDPLQLTLACDARLSPPNYVNDHIWQLDLSGGEPAALGIRTTYGLRARLMRLFPRFIEGGKSLHDPAQFISPPSVKRFFPNFLNYPICAVFEKFCCVGSFGKINLSVFDKGEKFVEKIKRRIFFNAET